MTHRPHPYQPLGDFLDQQEGAEVTLTFAEVEGVVGEQLPAAAWAQAWWANTPSEQGRVWLEAGWQVQWVRQLGDAAAVTWVRRPASTGFPHLGRRRRRPRD